MENRWSCPANESGASGRCRLGRRNRFGEGGSLENRRRHSWSVSGRTATGAGKCRGKRQSGSDHVARGSLWQNRGRHGRHYNVKTAKSKRFGRDISNLFSRFLSILLPRVAVAFGLCVLVLRIVLIPVYIAGIQILTAELATEHRIGFLSVLNGAVKYWPRVAGLGLFVYGVFFLLILFALGIAIMVVTSAALFS